MMKRLILEYPKSVFNLVLFAITLVSTVLLELIYARDYYIFYLFPLVVWQVGWCIAHIIYFEVIRKNATKYREHIIVGVIAIVPMLLWFLMFLFPKLGKLIL